jgi:hypothetical protein
MVYGEPFLIRKDHFSRSLSQFKSAIAEKIEDPTDAFVTLGFRGVREYRELGACDTYRSGHASSFSTATLGLTLLMLSMMGKGVRIRDGSWWVQCWIACWGIP